MLLVAMTLLPTGAPAAEEPSDERTTAYREFRSAFDAGNYAAALPVAARVVELTQAAYGPDAAEMANPLSNLATTYYRMREYGTALDNYRRALTVLDLQGDAVNARLVPPLHGMGMALRGLQRDDEAITPLKRAVDITRNRDGLHAPSQLPILKALIDAYIASGRYEDAGREQLYAFSVAESAWGKEDIRMLPALDDYARWNERTGRYTAARVLHTRALQIADAVQPQNPKAVDALRGIARTYRLAFVFGESDDSAAAAAEMPAALGNMNLSRAVSAPSSDGERALRDALQRLRGPGGTPALRGAVLLDLGDWYLTGGTGPRALATYREAWRELAATGDTTVLAQPTPVIYRPPSIAVSRRQEDPELHVEQDIEVRMSIAADGSVRDATIANPAPEREAAERAVMAAARRATWRPAFSNGEPVAATEFLFRERVYLRRPKAD